MGCIGELALCGEILVHKVLTEKKIGNEFLDNQATSAAWLCCVRIVS